MRECVYERECVCVRMCVYERECMCACMCMSLLWCCGEVRGTIFRTPFSPSTVGLITQVISHAWETLSHPHPTPTSQASAQLFFKVSSGTSPKGAVPTNLRTSVLLCFFGPDFSRPSPILDPDFLCWPYPKASLPSTHCAALTQHCSGDRDVFFTISEAGKAKVLAGPAVRAWSLHPRWYRITVSSWDRRERG